MVLELASYYRVAPPCRHGGTQEWSVNKHRFDHWYPFILKDIPLNQEGINPNQHTDLNANPFVG